MAIELSLTVKLIIFGVALVIGYLVLRYFDMDPIANTWEAVSNLEFNMTALILDIVISGVIWMIVWFNPFWVNSTAFGTPSKIFLSVALPIVGYPLAVRALNKD